MRPTVVSLDPDVSPYPGAKLIEREVVRDSRTAWQALGRVEYGLKSSEQGNAQFRRSLYFVRDMKAGDIIDATCIRSVRPGFGLPPKCYDHLIGKRVTRDIAAYTKTSWDCIDAA